MPGLHRDVPAVTTANLTPQACRGIELMAHGSATPASATTLGIQPHSVYAKVYTIKDKLGCQSREQIIAWHHRQRAAGDTGEHGPIMLERTSTAAPIRVVLADQDQASGMNTSPIVIELVITLQHCAGPEVDAVELAAPPIDTPLTEPLTRREREVFDLVAQRHPNREIAETLVLSESTVKRHMSRILAKLNVSNRYEAALHPQAQAVQRLKRAA